MKVKGVGISGEVRWNSTDGPVLAAAASEPDRTFVTEVVVPDAPPGVYFLVVKSSDHVARAPFEIVGARVELDTRAIGSAESQVTKTESGRASVKHNSTWTSGPGSTPESDRSKAPIVSYSLKASLALGTFVAALALCVTAFRRTRTAPLRRGD